MDSFFSWANLLDFLFEMVAILVVAGVIAFWMLRLNRDKARSTPVQGRPGPTREPAPGPLPPVPHPHPEPPVPRPPHPGPEPPAPPLPGGSA